MTPSLAHEVVGPACRLALDEAWLRRLVAERLGTPS